MAQGRRQGSARRAEPQPGTPRRSPGQAEVDRLRARAGDDEARAAADRLADGTHFHELRHYYASLLIRQGESVKVVQARLGRTSTMETLDAYGHLWPDPEDSTRAAIGLVLGTPTTRKRPIRVGGV